MKNRDLLDLFLSTIERHAPRCMRPKVRAIVPNGRHEGINFANQVRRYALVIALDQIAADFAHMHERNDRPSGDVAKTVAWLARQMEGEDVDASEKHHISRVVVLASDMLSGHGTNRDPEDDRALGEVIATDAAMMFVQLAQSFHLSNGERRPPAIQFWRLWAWKARRERRGFDQMQDRLDVILPNLWI